MSFDPTFNENKFNKEKEYPNKELIERIKLIDKINNGRDYPDLKVLLFLFVACVWLFMAIILRIFE